jgi:arsenate reductase
MHISSITIYHNPACGTSHNVLALIRNTGEEPTVVEYLKTPPDREATKTISVVQSIVAVVGLVMVVLFNLLPPLA